MDATQTVEYAPDIKGLSENMKFSEEIRRRRTFAIISHPDAGKTTLTEKFLLYGGAVQLAGSVTARKNQRASTSDWMELERQRGISVSSTVLQFDYHGFRVNLLDTPGHKDFSEDTYRVLTAVDAVVMVIDAAKGIESQTQKLFEVCRRRGVPIFTFMNKVDRPIKDPMALLDEIEQTLQLQVCPMNWPLGSGPDFKGVYDRASKQVHLFERVPGGSYRAPVEVADFSDELVQQQLPRETLGQVREELEMLEGAGETLDQETVLAGDMTPVFFGSASNNFGVQLLLDAFLKYSAPPQPKETENGRVTPEHERFSGFIFKIQANMDPKHRDRIAFLRVCSGKFTRDMSVTHSRTGKKVRLSSSHKLFGQDRETMDEGYAGDVLGLVGHTDFGIGDTLTEDQSIVFDEIPRFTPECFAYLISTNTSQFKRFRDGLKQLLQEGVVQTITLRNTPQKGHLLAAVGPLQFEVVQHRLKNEYGADSRLESAPWEVMRWLSPKIDPDRLDDSILPTGAQLAEDTEGQVVILFSDGWSAQFFSERNPECPISTLPFPRQEPAEVS